VTATNLVLLVGYIARAAVLSVRAPRQIQGRGEPDPLPSRTYVADDRSSPSGELRP
jgi:hypothetical protein